MKLPTELRDAIEREAQSVNSSALAQAARELSDAYRQQNSCGETFFKTETHRIAYIATRTPATFAAVRTALAEVRRLLPHATFASLLDLGAGSGAAAWAAAETFDELKEITLIERDEAMLRLGQRLARESNHAALRCAAWLKADLKSETKFAPHDLVTLSYSLGEIAPHDAQRILSAAWQAAQACLVIIEPGAPRGFQTICAAREHILPTGGFILAPCPRQGACPMPEHDWCHFAARLERSSLHRKLKSGAHGYEDEKFSYVCFTKEPARAANARVIRRPQHHPGIINLQLCAPHGLVQLTVTRKNKDAWRQARKIAWGDEWK